HRTQLAVGRLEHRAERRVAAASDADVVERVERATITVLLVAKLVALALQIFDSLVAPCRLRHNRSRATSKQRCGPHTSTTITQAGRQGSRKGYIHLTSSPRITRIDTDKESLLSVPSVLSANQSAKVVIFKKAV